MSAACTAMTSAPAPLRVWLCLRACSLTCSLASLLVCLLGGCAAGGPRLEAATERLPIAVPCIAVRPAAPLLPAVPQHGIFAQVQALLAREQLRTAYVRQLEALMDGCAGS
ncbi:hypothetical protein [Janthinobacterium sp. PAMC25594]|uniref:hypothetical protein n=1 Tax=Janthinobacterium sp. PAMC25594 TaxID=2861284 RepID=UPI001C624E67|nr:hypothetical protein [Janthinobacterium sp. PAMC25594]QYG07110.1 hypothetical protein KY494_28655 [Janthinobacterium sp. PAMC25594]